MRPALLASTLAHASAIASYSARSERGLIQYIWPRRGHRLNSRATRIALVCPASILFLLALTVGSSATGYAQQQSQPSATVHSSPEHVQGYTLPPAQEARAIAYARARHELYFLDVAYSLLLLVLMLQLRTAPKFRELAMRAGNNSFVQTIVFVPLLLLTFDILSLP